MFFILCYYDFKELFRPECRLGATDHLKGKL